MYQRLLVDRNRNWMPEIEKLFARPRPAFVVVGAAHLVGPDGLHRPALGQGLSRGTAVSGSLDGVEVFVVGAGLAGLTAARDLIRHGAQVTVADARSRLGGRVWTIREPFIEKQHAESGGDLIDGAQHEIQQLAKELGLKLTRILRGGFGYARPDASGQTRIVRRSAASGWNRLSDAIDDLTRLVWSRRTAVGFTDRRRSGQTVGGAVARRGQSRHRAARNGGGLRGFFLADPEELSLLALVDQFASSESPRELEDVPHRRRQRPSDRRAGGAAWRAADAEHRSRRRLASRPRGPPQPEGQTIDASTWVSGCWRRSGRRHRSWTCPARTPRTRTGAHPSWSERSSTAA